MDPFERENFRRGILQEVCRRLGHDYGDWQRVTGQDGHPYRVRSCRTCGRHEPQRIKEAGSG